jgi:hypothetical protein
VAQRVADGLENGEDNEQQHTQDPGGDKAHAVPFFEGFNTSVLSFKHIVFPSLF